MKTPINQFFLFTVFISIFQQLPKLDEELRLEMDRFEEENGAPFLVGGVPYVDFVEAQVHEHEAHQIQERTAKAQAKKEEVGTLYISSFHVCHKIQGSTFSQSLLIPD